jgi:alkylation response protein AidB-like acyl-CoA dehydrogenase
LTFILAPLSAPGITVRPIAQLDGETGFAEVFFDDVRVPVDQRLGHHNEGWNVFLTTAGVERGLYLRSPARFQETAKRLAALYQERGDPSDTASRNDVVQSWMDAEAFCLGTYLTASKFEAGESIGSESSCTKIFWSELDIAAHEAALRLLGPEAFLLGDGDPAKEGQAWLDGFLFSIAGPIYAGTNEIQRDIVAERVLGLPRSR